MKIISQNNRKKKVLSVLRETLLFDKSSLQINEMLG